jgi:hypothetical protein
VFGREVTSFLLFATHQQFLLLLAHVVEVPQLELMTFEEFFAENYEK